MYAFRLRLDMYGFKRIAFDHQEHVLDDSGAVRVVLQVVDADLPAGVTHASVAVTGTGYDSEEAADKAGAEWIGLIQRAFASMRIGADTGARRISDRWASAVDPSEPADPRTLADQPGLTVYEQKDEARPPILVRGSGFGSVGYAAETLVEALQTVRTAGAPLSPLEQTAYDLYSSSFSATSTDARFIVLMMAVETLITPQPRPPDVVAHVDTLLTATKQANLPSDQASSISSALTYLRGESIGQAGRRLARSLGDRQYKDLEPDRFFAKCYGLRSNLVHGGHPRPSGPEIEEYATHLEEFVADLLARGVSAA